MNVLLPELLLASTQTLTIWNLLPFQLVG
jgi:hypothetical protein